MRIIGIALIFFLSVAVLAQTTSQNPQAPYTVSVDVDLVVLSATVLDKDGRVVSGLDVNSFRVEEDGVAQDITFFLAENVPATVGLVIDNSGSMAYRRNAVVSAAMQFVHNTNDEDELFIVNFNDAVSLGLPDALPFTSDKNVMRTALTSVTANGRTALYDGIAAGLEQLNKGTLQKKALVVLSDGGDNASRQTLDDVLEMAQMSNAAIYTIGIYDTHEKDKNPGVLKQLAKATGGEAYLPRDVRQLPDIWRKIAGGLRGQYAIGYVSKNQDRDGKFRKVKISVVNKNHKNLDIRSRPGYIAGVR